MFPSSDAVAQVQVPTDPPTPEPPNYEDSACPLPWAGAQDRAASLFGDDDFYTQERQRLGITGVSPNDVQVVTPSEDEAACQALNDRYSDLLAEDAENPYRVAYFKAGPYYLSVFDTELTEEQKETGVVMVGTTAVILFNDSLHRLAGYGS